jgi:hypothetical protein
LSLQRQVRARATGDSPFGPREALAGEDARTVAREILVMDVDGSRAAFSGSPMKRAKLRGLQRNAAVVLGDIGTPDDADVLTRALAPRATRSPLSRVPPSRRDTRTVARRAVPRNRGASTSRSRSVNDARRPLRDRHTPRYREACGQ